MRTVLAVLVGGIPAENWGHPRRLSPKIHFVDERSLVTLVGAALGGAALQVRQSWADLTAEEESDQWKSNFLG